MQSPGRASCCKLYVLRHRQWSVKKRTYTMRIRKQQRRNLDPFFQRWDRYRLRIAEFKEKTTIKGQTQAGWG